VWHGGLVGSFQWKLGANQEWKAGALADFAQSHVSYTSYTRDDGSPSGGADPALTINGQDVTNTLSAGAYVQDRITIGKWTVFPGARVDVESVTFTEAGEPSLFLAGPSARLGTTYSPANNVVLHGFAGYLWQPPNTFDGVAAARVLVPSLAGQPLPFDLKAERDLTAELGVTARVVRGLSVSLTGWGRYAWDQLDRQNVGETNLIASYNYKQGRAIGVEASANGRAGRYLDGFANAGWQVAQGQGIDSERYLFTAEQAAVNAPWATLDHVQDWTVNAGFDLHDEKADSHFSASFNYGSGQRTGPLNNETIPSHAIVNLTLRHRFDLPLRPEVALDVYNLFDEVYAYRIATGDVGSAYAPSRTVVLRVRANFPK
jgi:outer membrane receptor for Fe3+-dicitrate